MPTPSEQKRSVSDTGPGVMRRPFFAGFTAWLFALVCALTCSTVMGQPSTFAIWKGDDMVGKVFVDRRTSGDRTHYSMNSRSKVMVLWPQHIRTAMSTEYVGGRLAACHTAVCVNDEVRDSSSMRTQGTKVVGYLHPGRVVPAASANSWTTARMYYEEPVGQTTIYVESVLRDCALAKVGAGIYELTLPDGHVNRYVYRNDVLHEIQVDRLFFDLVFRRV
jgi:hypothetical protein